MYGLPSRSSIAGQPIFMHILPVSYTHLGDSTFFHSGITGLVNMNYNAAKGTVIILDNRITGMTGHQDNPNTGRNAKGEPAPRCV